MDMATVLPWVLLAFLLVVLVTYVLLLQRVAQVDHTGLVEAIRQKLCMARSEAADSARSARSCKRISCWLPSVEELPRERLNAVLALMAQAPEDLVDLDEAPIGDNLSD